MGTHCDGTPDAQKASSSLIHASHTPSKETFFPDDLPRQSDWVDLIEYAFEQWETATDDLVTATPEYSNPATQEYEACTDMSWFRLFLFIRANDDVLSEIRMVDVNLAEAFLASTEMASDPFKLCILGGPACVTSRTDYGDDDRGAGYPLAGVDVTFNRSKFEDAPGARTLSDLKPHWYPRIPDDVNFNICQPDLYPVDDDPDQGYYAYITALHEAGHALGLSNVTDQWRYVVDAVPIVIRPFARDTYTASHSSTPDSVMNYDERIGSNLDPDTQEFTRKEPDCSPYPFDITAIYALYQSRGP